MPRAPDCVACGKPTRNTIWFAIPMCHKCYCVASDLRQSAQSKITCAIKQGRMPRAATFDCVDCGRKAYSYDHREYRKPFAVSPVCQRCNVMRGRSAEFGGSIDARGNHGPQ